MKFIAAYAISIRSRASKAWFFLALVLLFAALAPTFSANPHVQNLSATLQPPSSSTWLGSDHLGRSVTARLAEALRVSLGLAFGAAALAVALGTAAGLLAAWRGGWVDRALSLTADAVAALPALLWVLLLGSMSPGSLWPLYLGLVLTGWIEFFRYVRPTAQGLLGSQPVQASRLLGFGPRYVLVKHLAPPMGPTLLGLACYAVATAVLSVAALGFVGVGLRPPTAELGIMMTEALPYYAQAPWILAAPVLVLVGVVLALQSITSHTDIRKSAAVRSGQDAI